MRVFLAGLILLPAAWAAAQWNPAPPVDQPDAAEVERLRGELAASEHRIIYQTLRGDNWELFVMNADGGEARNLTGTPEINEYYPRVSPDGRQIAFEADQQGNEDCSEIWVMNADGSERRRIDEWAVQPSWSPDGRTLAYMRQRRPGSDSDYRRPALLYADVETGEIRRHPNEEVRNTHNLCWTLDGRWILAVVNSAMGVGQSIVAIEVDGMRTHNIIQQSRDLPPDPESGQYVMGCRPDISPDGRRVTWAIEEKHTRMWIGVADLEYEGDEPRARNWRWAATAPMEPFPWELYHPDWSPDGRFIAFSRGERGRLMEPARYGVRRPAPGWDICVVDPERPGHYIQITDDGLSNKEPDWLPPAGPT